MTDAQKIAKYEAAILAAKHLLEGADADSDAARDLLEETYFETK